MAKQKFKRGYVAGWTEAERLFALRLFKQIKIKDIEDEQEKRMLRRLLMRFMGLPLHRYPLNVSKECPICERVLSVNFDVHYERCKERARLERLQPKIDPTVLEMLCP